ncbi:NADP-dependent oxidoreductase [Actinoalloteichus hymeniacidonis]|uniref:NADP-dependent oxidoreductase n=1 Tax=Actinoalloteichus hymeniacidonis TaxID=340345 RepID=A0AAC9MXI1_9PSEU|nr:NADP-dependent oxidoreductase [Actinoalloteichus hymeniacidonis]AOS61907.1 putative NADP-dependent oxidoreductase [Actinoalloteichus hymeniacidonis]MBB5910073.1 hypothetical protein [Actinoalloteichus hymeniacidonis]
MPFSSREWHLIRRPVGAAVPSDFALVTSSVPDPGPGQVIVRNDYISVDPYMRGRMSEDKAFMAPFALGETMTGNAVGRVVASADPAVPVGSTVTHFLAWREHALLDAAEVRIVDPQSVPVQAYLSVLGVTGLTAWAALTEVAPVRDGDVVFVSAAAGGVGSVAGQLARTLGASKVIGSAGGPAKTALVTERFGFDAALDYRQGDLTGQLAAAAPEGIDVYVDNVGGDHLDAAILNMNIAGRIALVGAISVYDATEPIPGPSSLRVAIDSRLNLRGMNVIDHEHLAADYAAKAAGWLGDGSLVSEETVVDGIDQTVEAFLAMMRGRNVGKMLVRLDHG